MGWVCQTCSANNDDSQEKCLVCDSERPDPALKYDLNEQLLRVSEIFSGILSSNAESTRHTKEPSRAEVEREPSMEEPVLSVEEAYEQAMGLISSDPELHFKKIKECALRGYSPAQNRLGVCYQDGVGTAEDIDSALKWYNVAAEQDNMYAKYNLAVCYFLGLGVEESLYTAYTYVTQAALAGHPAAYKAWGDYYYHGYIFKRSVKDSIVFYERGADLGDVESQYMLGVIYETGPILKRSKKKAIEWYRKAAEQGHEDAREALRRLI